MEEELVDMVAVELGMDRAQVAKVVALLRHEKVASDTRIRRMLIRRKFFELIADPSHRRSARDIELDLSIEYDITLRSVQQIRSEII